MSVIAKALPVVPSMSYFYCFVFALLSGMFPVCGVAGQLIEVEHRATERDTRQIQVSDEVLEAEDLALVGHGVAQLAQEIHEGLG